MNNAGVIGPIGTLDRTDPGHWKRCIEVNLLGAYQMTRACLSFLRSRKGRVITVSSGAALKPLPSWSAYCAAKAGATHMVRVLAEEEPELTALAFRPGVVDTAMQEEIRRKGPGAMPPKLMEYFQGLKENGKLEAPGVPAKALAWMALAAPHGWSGGFLDYDDPKVKEASEADFKDIDTNFGLRGRS